jgi:hypothetical protein
MSSGNHLVDAQEADKSFHALDRRCIYCSDTGRIPWADVTDNSDERRALIREEIEYRIYMILLRGGELRWIDKMRIGREVLKEGAICYECTD